MDAALMARGLLAGLIATGGMTLVELAARSLWGLEALLDWQMNQATAARILKRRAEDLVLAGLGFHFLHGALAGLVFVLVLPFLPSGLPIWILGIGYGVVLFAVTLGVRKSITGRAFGSRPVASVAFGVTFIAHVVYGALLGFLIAGP